MLGQLGAGLRHDSLEIDVHYLDTGLSRAGPVSSGADGQVFCGRLQAAYCFRMGGDWLCGRFKQASIRLSRLTSMWINSTQRLIHLHTSGA